MESQSIQEYEQLEKYYWWFVGRRHIIDNVLRKFFSHKHLAILDWGCGPGGNFGLLERYGTVLGVDASDEALSACKRKGITHVVKAEDPRSFVTNAQYDLVTSLDVVEHIPDDEGFLREVKGFLKPGGHILVTVPAYQFLWGPLDEAAGHQRRYTRGKIIKMFSRCGYRVIMSSYFMFFLSPAFILYRMFERLTRKKTASLSGSVVAFPKPIHWLFTKILSLEARIIPWVSLPFGTSIIVLAEKSKNYYEKI